MPRNSEAVTSRFRSTSMPYLFLTKMIYKTNQISLNFPLSIHTKQQLALYEWEPHNVQHILLKALVSIFPSIVLRIHS